MDFLRSRGRSPQFIATHPKWTAPGWVFITEANDKHYICCNSKDWTRAVARARMQEFPTDLSDEVYGIPVTEHEQDIQVAVCGWYIRVWELA